MADLTILKADDLVISGNLTVKGTEEVITTTQTDLHIKDRIITLNKGGTLGGNTAGIEIESGGGIVATMGYTTASGFDFGNKNITTSGTIAGTFNIAVNSINDTHLDWGTGADQISTADIPENTNLFYTQARFDAALTAKDTDALSEGSTNLYYTVARANSAIDARVLTTSVNSLQDVDTSGVASNNTLKWNGTAWVPGDPGHSTTDTLNEGSTNLYYTNARADARIAAASINALSDVNTTGAANGKVLMWDGTNYVPNEIAVGAAKAQKGTLASNLTHTATSTGAAGDHGTIVMSGPLINYTAGQGKFLVSVDLSVNQSHSHLGVDGSGNGTGHGNKYEFKVHKVQGGAAVNYASPVYSATVSGWEEHISLQFIDDGSVVGHGSAPDGVTYHVTTNTISNGATVYNSAGASAVASTITISSINGYAVELNDKDFNIGELKNVLITTPAEGHQLYYENATSKWKNHLPTLSKLSDVDDNLNPAGGQILKYTAGATNKWQHADFSLNDVSDVNTAGVANGSIIKYNGSNWVIASDVDTTTDVLDDTTPQLGGDLDVNGKQIVTTSNGNIALTPNGSGQVIITGDLTVTGTATTMDVQNMTVEDSVILVNKHDSQPANNTNDAGIMVQRGSSENNAAWFWEETTDRWIATTTTSAANAVDITVTANADIQAGTVYATATTAQYADLAEIYESDSNYEPGTVVVFGGEKEVTQSTHFTDHRVAGVVSSNPAYLMNKDAEGVAVALRSKVPCKIDGPVKKGDIIVTGTQPGTATGLAEDSAMPSAVCVIGKSIEDDSGTGVRLINIVV